MVATRRVVYELCAHLCIVARSLCIVVRLWLRVELGHLC